MSRVVRRSSHFPAGFLLLLLISHEGKTSGTTDGFPFYAWIDDTSVIWPGDSFILVQL